jgi:hypothetical protein
VVPLTAAADAHQPAVRILTGKLRHQDVRVHKPVRRDVFHHHGQAFSRLTQVLCQCFQQLFSRLLPVDSGLRQMNQPGKIVDELPQFFIHAQTLAVTLVSRGSVCHSGSYPFHASSPTKG